MKAPEPSPIHDEARQGPASRRENSSQVVKIQHPGSLGLSPFQEKRSWLLVWLWRHLPGLASCPRTSIDLLQKGGHTIDREVVAQPASPPPHAHCSLFLPPVPLDPEKVLEELQEKDKLDEVSGSLGTA